MPKKPRSSPSNKVTRIMTSVMETIQANVNFDNLRIKKNAKVPTIIIKDNENRKTDSYPLLGERYIIGRSSRDCDIILRNDLVSKLHCIIEKDRKKSSVFVIRDKDSANGIYYGKKRCKNLSLRHGDKITLGPPELQNVVEIRYDYPPRLWVLIFRYFLFSVAGIITLILLWVGSQWLRYEVDPLPQGVTGPVVIYSDDGKTPLTPKVTATHKELESLSDFSPYLRQALIASEDSRFYWHFGVDPIGVARALQVNRQEAGVSQGASTLTQQVARSLFPDVGRENTIARKIREIMVASKLEAYYSKDKILKTYLNRVYLGVNSYGFEDASQFYFDKSATSLNLNEAATLVAILPAPNAYNPVQNYDKAVKNRNLVLDRMYKLGMISEDENKRASRSRIIVSPKARQRFSEIIAPYFYGYIFEELDEVLGYDVAKEGDFIIETALNPEIQKEAENAIKEHINSNGRANNFSQGAMVTLDTKTGEIIALVGGKDYGESQFNRATQAQRQPGSTFKVFAYSAALEQGISPYKTYSCASLRWGGFTYKPCERSGGNVNMVRGMAQSENAIALRVARNVGLNKVVEMAKSLGVKSELKEVPGLVLGQSETNVLEMTGAYAAIANQGVWNRPHGIKTIRDGRDCQDINNEKTCRLIYVFNQDKTERTQAISQKVAQNMDMMMKEVVTSGTGRNASIGLQEAGKTGTTNKGVDLWFIGYISSKNVATGIWLGNDDNSPTGSSSSQAASLWNKYMKKIVPMLSPEK